LICTANGRELELAYAPPTGGDNSKKVDMGYSCKGYCVACNFVSTPTACSAIHASDMRDKHCRFQYWNAHLKFVYQTATEQQQKSYRRKNDKF